MGNWFVITSTLLYLGAAISYSHEGRHGLAIMYYGYAFANIGILGIALKLLT